MAEAFFSLWAKKSAHYAVWAHFWCPVVTLVTFISNLNNFERNPKNHKKSKKKSQKIKNQKIQKSPKKIQKIQQKNLKSLKNPKNKKNIQTWAKNQKISKKSPKLLFIFNSFFCNKKSAILLVFQY